jgi:hypothetical protein
MNNTGFLPEGFYTPEKLPLNRYYATVVSAWSLRGWHKSPGHLACSLISGHRIIKDFFAEPEIKRRVFSIRR